MIDPHYGLLTVAYVTSRIEPHFEWFYESMMESHRQTGASLPFRVLIIYRHMPERFPPGQGYAAPSVQAYPPKPSVWSGPHRLTKEDWFSASNARNTALCCCQTPYICYVDDLSLATPSWLPSVWEAVDGNYIGLGAYKKVRNLVVEKGAAVSFDEFPGGIDNRLGIVTKDVSECNGEWLYGASLVGPTEAFLEINGWPEDLCDGMGFEDCLTGIVLQNAGYHLKYDRRMLTLESDELHSAEPAMVRHDYGDSPNDKSHSALNIAKASKHFPNSFGEGGIRALRERRIAGLPFPIRAAPDREWFTGTLLSEL